MRVFYIDTRRTGVSYGIFSRQYGVFWFLLLKDRLLFHWMNTVWNDFKHGGEDIGLKLTGGWSFCFLSVGFVNPFRGLDTGVYGVKDSE